jgi:hypothetical protein
MERPEQSDPRPMSNAGYAVRFIGTYAPLGIWF